MTGPVNLDRLLADWFETDAAPAPPALSLMTIIEGTRHRRPRPAWLAGLGRHWRDVERATDLRPRASSWAGWGFALLAASIAGVAMAAAAWSQPSLSRPGRLAYVQDGTVRIADADGSDPVLVEVPSEGRDGACAGYGGDGPMWSPDGRHVAFRSTWSDTCPGRVIVADATGRFLASVPGSGWRIAWSPDGTRFATWVDLGTRIGVYTLDGTRVALLDVPPGFMAAGDFDPVWSPDDAGLVVPHGVLIPLDGGPPVRLPMTDPRSSRSVAFTADASRAAFTKTDGSLTVAAADGSDAKVLLPGVTTYGNLVWSPAGDQLAFSASDGSITAVWTIDVETGTPTRWSSPNVSSPTVVPIRFSPDGTALLVTGPGRNGPAWLGRLVLEGPGYLTVIAGAEWADWQPPLRDP